MAKITVGESGIYCIRNTHTGRVYVGSAVDIPSRWRLHIQGLEARKHHCFPLQAAWEKHGKSAFEFELLERVTDKWQLVLREQHWINKMSAFMGTGGYNVLPTAGSHLGAKRSEETRERMRQAAKGRKVSEEGRAKMRAAWTRRQTPSPEEKAKKAALVSAVHKGRQKSDTERSNIRAALTGKRPSAQCMAAAKIAQSARPSAITKACLDASRKARIGSKHTPETKARISAAIRSHYDKIRFQRGNI